jgi:hypothetical protein
MKKFNLLIIMGLFLGLIWMGCENANNPVMSEGTLEPSLSLQKETANPIVLPEDARIESATLNIYAHDVNGKKVNVHRITDDWTEETVTWNSFAGSYDPNIIYIFKPENIGWINIDLTELVKAWIRGEYSNYGVLLDQEAVGESSWDRTIYNSKDNTILEPYNKPYFEIKYMVNSNLESVKEIISADAYIWEMEKNEPHGLDYRLFTGYLNGAEKQSLIRFNVYSAEDYKCETAFAYSVEGVSECFTEHGFNNWGWTNGPLSEREGEYNFDIYAGAGQCDITKGTMVGDLKVNYDGSAATFTFSMNQSFTLNEVHLYAGSALFPTDKKGNFRVAPGQYPVVDENPDAATYTYTINNLSGDIYIIAHAVVCGYFNDDQDENDRSGDEKDDGSKNREFGKLNIYNPGRGRGRGR